MIVVLALITIPTANCDENAPKLHVNFWLLSLRETRKYFKNVNVNALIIVIKTMLGMANYH